MATVVSRSRPRTITGERVGVRIPIWLGVVFSRLLVMGGSAAGALFAQVHADSVTFDPHGFSRGLGSVGNVLAASTSRWDSIHYIEIARHGYTTAVSTAYFPLYPLLIHVVAWLTRSDVLAGVLISVVAFAIALELLHRLARQELDDHVANGVILLLAFAPLSLFFTAVYTESLFLALSVGAFYLARNDRLALASVVTAAAALTHIQGILLVVPLAFCWWQRQGKACRVQGKAFRIRELVRWQGAPLLFPFAALAGLMVYLHGRGFGWIAPISNETNPAWHHQFVGPVIGVALAVKTGLVGLWQTAQGVQPIPPTGSFALSYPFQSFVYLLMLLICLAALYQTWRRLPRMYTVYSVLYLIVLTSSPIKGDPLASFDRYSLMLFPLWIAAAAWLRDHRLLRPTIEIGSILLLFYAFQFGRWVFIA